MTGAASHSVRMGAATGRAAGRAPVTMTRTTSAISGLAAISPMNSRMSLRALSPAARAAAAAAVSHSSRRRWVNSRRISVSAMACTISYA